MDVTPLYSLRLRTPRLELRLGSRAELFELGRLAERGIHPPDRMPFFVAWTDRTGQPDFLEQFVAFHDRAVENWSPGEWTLNLLVWEQDALVGTQSVGAESFAESRRVSTGSLLGAEHQRRGLGTEMRAAVLELAFAGLAARERPRRAGSRATRALVESRRSSGTSRSGVRRRARAASLSFSTTSRSKAAPGSARFRSSSAATAADRSSASSGAHGALS